MGSSWADKACFPPRCRGSLTGLFPSRFEMLCWDTMNLARNVLLE